MSSVSFVITIYNKQDYLKQVLEALKNQQGDFEREFIFIDDGSTDNSYKILSKITSNWQNTHLIHGPNNGPSNAVNKAIDIAKYDYIKFVDGDEVLTNDATTSLLEALIRSGLQVAYGKCGKYHLNEKIEYKTSNNYEKIIIDDPIKDLLLGRNRGISSIGASRGLVATKLIKKIEGADKNIFVQDFSIALKCALHSKFIYLDKEVVLSPQLYDERNLSTNKQQEYYDTILALSNFLQNNLNLLEDYYPLFYKRLAKVLFKNHLNIHGFKGYFSNYFIKYIFSKFNNKFVDKQTLLSVYKLSLEKFNRKNIRVIV
jgi:glycosyltransferase involved in cell wall biosynthesis